MRRLRHSHRCSHLGRRPQRKLAVPAGRPCPDTLAGRMTWTTSPPWSETRRMGALSFAGVLVRVPPPLAPIVHNPMRCAPMSSTRKGSGSSGHAHNHHTAGELRGSISIAMPTLAGGAAAAHGKHRRTSIESNEFETSNQMSASGTRPVAVPPEDYPSLQAMLSCEGSRVCVLRVLRRQALTSPPAICSLSVFSRPQLAAMRSHFGPFSPTHGRSPRLS